MVEYSIKGQLRESKLIGLVTLKFNIFPRVKYCKAGI